MITDIWKTGEIYILHTISACNKCAQTFVWVNVRSSNSRSGKVVSKPIVSRSKVKRERRRTRKIGNIQITFHDSLMHNHFIKSSENQEHRFQAARCWCFTRLHARLAHLKAYLCRCRPRERVNKCFDVSKWWNCVRSPRRVRINNKNV